MIEWPAIIEFADGHGFAWLAGAQDLPEQHPHQHDRLIDSRGRVHLLSQAAGGTLYWRRQQRLLSLPELNDGLRAYAARLGICCIGKLVVRTPAEAVALVAWLEQQ
ncbi:hypothetical protein C7H85_09630 [Zobellella endophytica]|uniref:Uncharacterized protein n=1 Tax=Zobellella endophytica TaxID=2116700 RepID=A0A2P7R602_9GAMM|nr:DUF4144 family protein [Zobellella endophytica]PSJ45634.1 hypothetical protein C7H85_09630 [Zobellella endophytica]